MIFRSHKRTFLLVIATKSKCNNDLRQGSFHVNSSNIIWPCQILCTQSTVVLHKYSNYDLKLLSYNFSQRLHRIFWVFYVQKNPRVFQVCGTLNENYVWYGGSAGQCLASSPQSTSVSCHHQRHVASVTLLQEIGSSSQLWVPLNRLTCIISIAGK